MVTTAACGAEADARPRYWPGSAFPLRARLSVPTIAGTPDTYDDTVFWVFDGVSDEVLGDFGLCGGGAAGFELDRVDECLGSPPSVRILASSENHTDDFIVVPEEMLTHLTNWPGEPMEKLIRADMVYFETPAGGRVFSTGSITFCGSLLHNDGDNNISRIVANVLDRFLA